MGFWASRLLEELRTLTAPCAKVSFYETASCASKLFELGTLELEQIIFTF